MPTVTAIKSCATTACAFNNGGCTAFAITVGGDAATPACSSDGPHSQTDFNPIIQFLADHVGGALYRGATRRTDEGERVDVAEFGQVVLVPSLPALIEISGSSHLRVW